MTDLPKKPLKQLLYSLCSKHRQMYDRVKERHRQDKMTYQTFRADKYTG